MSPAASRACRADRRLGGAGGKVPREFKRAWALMSSKERGRLRRKWRESQRALSALGRMKWEQQHPEVMARIKLAEESFFP